jgi:hypothetical protein
MDEITATIDRFLEAHQSGLRDFDDTAGNLRTLHRKLSPEDQRRFFEHLWTRLTRQLHRKPLPRTQGRVQQPSIVRAIMRSAADFGPVDFFVRLFAHLDCNNPVIVKSWETDDFPEMILAMTNHPDRFPQQTLDALKGNAAPYTNATGGVLAGMEATSELEAAALRLEAVIAELEFNRFEKAVANQGAADDNEITLTEELEIYLTSLGVQPSVAGAMTEARTYLSTSGPFDPKKAADLLRSSIDEVHRAIVKGLVELTGKPFSHKNSDGGRRRYMADVGFISSAEETFFSAIYSLISEEATHRLLAPKETVLLLEKTVSGYLILLARRLSERKGQTLSIGP